MTQYAFDRKRTSFFRSSEDTLARKAMPAAKPNELLDTGNWILGRDGIFGGVRPCRGEASKCFGSGTAERQF
jgi:hypothetical protein